VNRPWNKRGKSVTVWPEPHGQNNIVFFNSLWNLKRSRLCPWSLFASDPTLLLGTIPKNRILSSSKNCTKCQSKPSNLVKWAQLISADFSFKFSAFTTFQSRGLLLWGFFFEKSLSNICRKLWLTKDYRGGFKNPLHCPEKWTQQNGNQKQEFQEKVLRIGRGRWESQSVRFKRKIRLMI